MIIQVKGSETIANREAYKRKQKNALSCQQNMNQVSLDKLGFLSEYVYYSIYGTYLFQKFSFENDASSV